MLFCNLVFVFGLVASRFRKTHVWMTAVLKRVTVGAIINLLFRA